MSIDNAETLQQEKEEIELTFPVSTIPHEQESQNIGISGLFELRNPDRSTMQGLNNDDNMLRLGENSRDQHNPQKNTSQFGLHQRKVKIPLPERESTSNKVQLADPHPHAHPTHPMVKRESNSLQGTDNQNQLFAGGPWELLGWISSTRKRKDKLGAVNQSQYYEDIKNTDRHIRLVSVGCVTTYLILVTLCYGLCPSESIQQVEGLEHTAAMIAFVCLLLGITLRMVSFLYNRGSAERNISGIIVGAMTVQSIALVTDFIMAFLPSPVVIDPMTSSRVHLLRWCEWTPLAFTLTFMTEAADVPDPVHGLKIAYLNAFCMGLSTFCGLISPFCTGWLSWSFWMTVSCVFFCFIFPRLYQKAKSAKKVKKGNTLDEIEIYDRSRLSLQLMVICALMWSLIVFIYFVTSCGSIIFADGSRWRHPAAPMIGEAFMDVVAKVIYLFIIVDIHDAVFDKVSRTKRRLDELRRMMSVVWESSSDVLVISVKSLTGSATTIVSPTFAHMLGGFQDESATRCNNQCKSRALMFELGAASIHSDIKMSEHKGQHDTNVSHISMPTSWLLDDDSDEGTQGSSFAMEGETTAMAQLVARAWRSPQIENLILHNLIRQRDNCTTLIPCEAKVTHLDNTAIVIVVRDVSERYKHFEAEKRIVSETTARQKDAETNCFVRHEVKNGLLAAIGLCDSLSESVEGEQKEELMKDDVSGSVIELDKTLREILDKVMSGATIRDVINEIYHPQNTVVDFHEILCMKGYVVDSMSVKGPRFPVITFPSPLPTFLFDPQLLRFIHRNAVSNACKYGKKGGLVKTVVYYNSLDQSIRMSVINLPGPGHKEILKLGSDANEFVFGARQRLHVHRSHSKENNGVMSQSAGDGAWIMQKCAKTLGGKCSISFEDNRTVLTLLCPVTPFDVTTNVHTPINTCKFQLPPHTWGIAIDDSKTQRRFLQKMFGMAGVSNDRTIVLGKNNEEIQGFADFMVKLLEIHPRDYFFVVVNENMHLGTVGDELKNVSGSCCIQSIRHRLSPAHESRMLAVVRSAKDSAHDIAIYNSRAHGFFPKANTKKVGVTSLIALLWKKRFPQQGCLVLVDDLSVISDDSTEGDSITVADLMVTIEEIDEILSSDARLNTNWPLLQEKLHYLKGDLSTLPDSVAATNAVIEINSIREMRVAVYFPDRWQKLRQTIISISIDPVFKGPK